MRLTFCRSGTYRTNSTAVFRALYLSEPAAIDVTIPDIMVACLDSHVATASSLPTIPSKLRVDIKNVLYGIETHITVPAGPSRIRFFIANCP